MTEIELLGVINDKQIRNLKEFLNKLNYSIDDLLPFSELKENTQYIVFSISPFDLDKRIGRLHYYYCYRKDNVFYCLNDETYNYEPYNINEEDRVPSFILHYVN